MFPWSQLLRDSKPAAAGSRSLSCSSSDQIRAAANKNVSEISASSQETEAEKLKSAMPHFLQGLQCILENEKEDYVHAIRVAPQLVETESDPVAFLRFCNWDGPGAARRLCVYWRKRVEVFGKERAFLPLLNDFSGNGALGRDEIELLKHGVFSLMPADTYGRSVGHADRSRAPPHLVQNLGAKLRACFLVLQQMMQNPASQTEGVVWVIRGIQSYEENNILRPAMQLLREAFPLRVHAFHVAYVQQDKRNFFQRHIIGLLMKHFGRFFYNKTVVHDCVSVEQFLERMAIKHGVPRTSLPLNLGGLANTDGTTAGDTTAMAPASSLKVAPNADGAVEPPGVTQPRQVPQQQATELKIPTLEDALPIMLANNTFPVSSLDTSLGGTNTDGATTGATTAAAAPACGDNDQISAAVDKNVSEIPVSSQRTEAEMLQSAISRFLQALQAIPADEKEEYMHAMRVAPKVVETESGPVAFLRLCNWDGPRAALCLCSYWKNRKEIFGETRAFLPLDNKIEILKPNILEQDLLCADNDDHSISSQESYAASTDTSFEDFEEGCTPLDWAPIPLLDDSNDESLFGHGTETDHFSEMADVGFLDIFDGPSSSNLLSPEQRQQVTPATAHAAVPPVDRHGKLFGLEGVAFGGLGQAYGN